MAKDPQRRRVLEALLSLHLRKADEETVRDPKVRLLVDRVRKMYREDRPGIFAAFTATTRERAQAVPLRPPPPPSRIPQLLYLLSELTRIHPGGSELPTLQSPKSLANQEGSLPEATRQKPIARPVAEASANDRERALMRDIESAKKTLALIKKEESLIRARRGRYGVAGERLRAERLLRELPGQIAQMEHTLQLLRDGLL